MATKTFLAKTEVLSDLISYVEQTLEQYECSIKTQTSICIAIEEVFVNVAHYAYGKVVGEVTLGIEFDKKTRNVTFKMVDSGVPFNPLAKPDPDITLSAQQREIGGLGIFITKKTMDYVEYTYQNGKNVLTMIKKI